LCLRFTITCRLAKVTFLSSHFDILKSISLFGAWIFRVERNTWDEFGRASLLPSSPQFYERFATSERREKKKDFVDSIQNSLLFLLFKKTQLQVCEEAGSFITNLIKLNARQLISNKLDQKKRVKKVSTFYQSQPQTATDTNVIQINTLKPKSAVNPSGNKVAPSQRSSTMRSYENDFYERNNNNSPEMFTHNHSNEPSRKLPGYSFFLSNSFKRKFWMICFRIVEIGERVVLEPAKMGQIIAIENSTFLVIQFEKMSNSTLKLN